MKASEISARRNRIVELLQERGTLSIKEAVRLLDVSHETIRQDFNHLEQQGLLKKFMEVQSWPILGLPRYPVSGNHPLSGKAGNCAGGFAPDSKGPLHHRLGQWQHRCSFGIKACGSLS